MLVDGIKLAEGSLIGSAIMDPARRGIQFPASPTHGTTFDLTATYNGKAPGIYIYNSTDADWIIMSPEGTAVPYDISGCVLGTMLSGAIVSKALAVRSFKIKVGFEGCLAQSGAGATAMSVLTIKKLTRQGIEAVLGSITFQAGQTVGTFAQNGSSVIHITRGETLMVVAPNPADSTLGDITFTFAGSII